MIEEFEFRVDEELAVHGLHALRHGGCVDAFRLLDVPLCNSECELTHTEDIGRPLGDADAVAGVEDIEQVRTLQAMFERRPDQTRAQQRLGEPVVLVEHAPVERRELARRQIHSCIEDVRRLLDFVAQTADVVAKTLGELANAPSPPRRVTLGGAVTPNAEISLEGNKDPERAGYEILWRETTEARWSVVKTIDANTPAAGSPAASGAPAAPGSLPLEESFSSILSSVSTDNHYFAVRSVGKNGKRSIAVAAVAAARRPPGYVSMEAPRVTPPPVTIPSGPPVK